MILSLLLVALLTLLRLTDLILSLPVVALLLSLLFPTLLAFLRLTNLLLSLLLVTLLALLTVALLLLASLLPALLLFALTLLLCRLAILLGLLGLLGLPAVILFLLTLLLALFARGLILLTPLFTATASSLRVGKVARAQQRGGYRQRQSQFFQIIRVHQKVPFLFAGGERVDAAIHGKHHSTLIGAESRTTM